MARFTLLFTTQVKHKKEDQIGSNLKLFVWNLGMQKQAKV